MSRTTFKKMDAPSTFNATSDDSSSQSGMCSPNSPPVSASAGGQHASIPCREAFKVIVHWVSGSTILVPDDASKRPRQLAALQPLGEQFL